MDMNYQQRSEYIEQCQRKIAAQDAAYRKDVAAHEAEIQRIVIESQAEMLRMLCAISPPLRTAATKKQRITVAM